MNNARVRLGAMISDENRVAYPLFRGGEQQEKRPATEIYKQ